MKMNSALIAVIVEQYNKILELESQISSLNQAVKAHAIGIGELNQYLMNNEIGIVGDMTAKAALKYIKELKSRFTTLDEANGELLGDYLVARDRVSELEEKLKAQPDPPEPEDAYLSDFRVLKTAIEIAKFAKRQSGCPEWKSKLCDLTISTIKGFVEEVRLWDGLDDLEPYLWGTPGSREEHLVDREWKK